MSNNLSRRQILKAAGGFFAGAFAAGGVPIITSLTANRVQAQTSKVSLPNLSDWANLISFRPSKFVQTEVKRRSWDIHRIEDAWGQINLDYYPVTITRLPIIPDTNNLRYEPPLLLGLMLYSMNYFVDTNLAEFYPYDTQDKSKLDILKKKLTEKSPWSDYSSLLSIGVSINIKQLGSKLEGASVIVSNFGLQSWTFSTIETPKDSGHPVSGNREFGYIANPNKTYTFYTRGADRTTAILDNIFSTDVFEGGEKLWQSFQKTLVFQVNKLNGRASVGKSFSKRYDWEAIKAKYHKPKTEWF